MLVGDIVPTSQRQVRPLLIRQSSGANEWVEEGGEGGSKAKFASEDENTSAYPDKRKAFILTQTITKL